MRHLNSSAVFAVTTVGGKAFQSGIVCGKCLRPSVYDKYLVYCESYDALVYLNPGASIRYLNYHGQQCLDEFCRTCSRRASGVGHGSSSGIAPTWLVFRPNDHIFNCDNTLLSKTQE